MLQRHLSYTRLATFRHSREGVAALEFAMIAPVLALLFLGSFTIFSSFSTSQRSEKATFTVGDLISRQTQVDSTFLNQMYATFQKLNAGSPSELRFRVSSIIRDGTDWKIAWSFAVAPEVKLTKDKIPVDVLPTISDQDSIIITETTLTSKAAFAILGVTNFDHSNVAVVRPRFVSAIVKTD